MATTASDLTSQIVAYEAGELDTVGFLVFFAELIRTEATFTFQGSYELIAADLMPDTSRPKAR